MDKNKFNKIMSENIIFSKNQIILLREFNKLKRWLEAPTKEENESIKYEMALRDRLTPSERWGEAKDYLIEMIHTKKESKATEEI